MNISNIKEKAPSCEDAYFFPIEFIFSFTPLSEIELDTDFTPL